MSAKVDKFGLLVSATFLFLMAVMTLWLFRKDSWAEGVTIEASYGLGVTVGVILSLAFGLFIWKWRENPK
jgi:hypothetical protein